MSSAPRKRVLSIVLIAGLLAGAGIFINFRLRAPAEDHAIELVPADARAYLHVFLKPSTSQRRALQDLLARFPQTDEDDEAKKFVSDVLHEALARFDIAIGDDAGEWLGNEAAAYVPAETTAPVVLLEVDDEDDARAELGEALGERPDAPPIAFVDGFAVIPIDDAPVIPSEDGSLSDVGAYRDLVDDLDAHRLALFYSPGLTGSPAAATLRVTPSAVVVDAVTDGPLETFPSARGFMIADFAGVNGALSIELPPGVSARAVEAAARAAVPTAAIDRQGQTLTATVGEPRSPDDIPARLADASDESLGAGFGTTLAIDASGLPSALRAPLLQEQDDYLRPLLEQFLTLNLGVKEVASKTIVRLVITFSSA